MVDENVVSIVRRYLAALPSIGIHPTRAILFGSQARGQAGEWSDIDLIIIAPEFDSSIPMPMEFIERLWQARAGIDWRIEPVPCGVAEWQAPHSRPILSAAEQEGFEVAA